MKARNKQKSLAQRMKPADRLKLRAAVLKAFSQNDFHNVDMRSIAADCSMSFATIYKYFGSKEVLLFDFINEWLEELQVLLLDGMGGIESPREKMRRHLWVHLNYFQSNPDIARVLFMTVPVQTWMRDQTYAQSAFFRLLISVARDGQEQGLINPKLKPFHIIDLTYGVIQRSIVMWEYRKRRYALTAQFEPLFTMLWSGIGSKTD